MFPLQPWLFRPHPYCDELLSSWLVRIAWHNVQKLEMFSSDLWGTRSQVWSRDIDRTADSRIFEVVAEKACVSRERAWQTTLEPYEGVLYERHVKRGAATWLMPIGCRQRSRRLFGLQCCPVCLLEDTEPYYRRSWRLSFMSACRKHQVMLIDRCDRCGSPISFHESDFGSYDWPEELRMTVCKHCQRDYRDILPVSLNNHPLGHWVAQFQAGAEKAMEFHWATLDNGIEIMSLLYFEGLRHLNRVLAENSHAAVFRQAVAGQLNMPFDPIEYAHGHFVERLDAQIRFFLCGMMGWLLADWPEHFIWSCKVAKLSSDYFQDRRKVMPYWLSMPIKWYADRSLYHPADDEVAEVVRYLASHGLSTSHNNVRRWLGRWHVDRHKIILRAL